MGSPAMLNASVVSCIRSSTLWPCLTSKSGKATFLFTFFSLSGKLSLCFVPYFILLQLSLQVFCHRNLLLFFFALFLYLLLCCRLLSPAFSSCITTEHPRPHASHLCHATYPYPYHTINIIPYHTMSTPLASYLARSLLASRLPADSYPPGNSTDYISYTAVFPPSSHNDTPYSYLILGLSSPFYFFIIVVASLRPSSLLVVLLLPTSTCLLPTHQKSNITA